MTAIDNFNFKPSVARWNMKTNEIKFMPYEHPDIKKKRYEFDASEEHNLYVESYTNHDLMIIADLDGNLICNTYGPEWGKDYPRPRGYHTNVWFCRDKIITLYTGDDRFVINKREINLPTKFLIFDLDGNHLKTLETDYHIVRFCYNLLSLPRKLREGGGEILMPLHVSDLRDRRSHAVAVGDQ